MDNQQKTREELKIELQELQKECNSLKTSYDDVITELKLSEKKYRALFENDISSVALHKVLVDKKGKPEDLVYVDVNDVFEKITGLKRKDIIGKKVTDVIPGFKEAKPDLISIYGKVALTGENIKFELSFEPFQTHYSIDAFSPEEGYCCVVADDITERKQTEEKLRESEEKYYSLFSEMADGVYLHEIIYNQKGEAIDYRIIETNSASEKHLNIKPKDANGKLATEFYGTGEAPYLDLYAKVAKTGIPLTFEEYFQPLKKHFHIYVYSQEKGKFTTIFSDITKRKLAETEIEESREKYRGLSEAAFECIFLSEKGLCIEQKVLSH